MGKNCTANCALVLMIWTFGACGWINAQSKVEVSDEDLVAKPKYLTESYLINNNLKHYHFRKQSLNDSLAAVVFQNYLRSLDYNKTYFLKSDIDYFAKYETELDDQIKEGNVDFAFQVFKTFRNRANTRLDYVNELIDKGFDFDLDEDLLIDSEMTSWAETVEEINERWRKSIKSQALNLKLAGKDDDGIKKGLKERFERYRKGIMQYNSDDVYQFYMNSFTESYDPHTNYFSPLSSENFNISMSLSLEGIGARLSQSLDYTIVSEVIAGGPAFKSKSLHKDDKIIAVAQNEDGEFEDVIGWRIEDVVQKIRGPKGSVVRLRVIKHDKSNSAPPEDVRLVRDKIKLEEQSAKSEVYTIEVDKQKYNLGVITLPSFYIDFDEARQGVKDYKSTTRDVRKIITDLKAKNIDGLLIDLRYNGGGSLKEAIDLTGLFIDRGPVVQVKSSNGHIDVQKDIDPGTEYDGPLMVLINRFSASASEIFSGAIQDYKRGVVVGETSFGKGTVQNLIDLNRRFPGNEDKLGQLKLTVAKFYRITGSSTQNIGVTPDILFPSPFTAEDFGESSNKNALPWDKIDLAYYQTTNHIGNKTLKHLNQEYLEDMTTDQTLKFRVEDVKRAKVEQERETVTLNYAERKKEQMKDDDLDKQRKKQLESAKKSNNEFFGEKEAVEQLLEDLELKESLRLLSSLVKEQVG